ncbi:hypothetical protein CsSME_00046059 [Camellia sinensis var. sinensis]
MGFKSKTLETAQINHHRVYTPFHRVEPTSLTKTASVAHLHHSIYTSVLNSSKHTLQLHHQLPTLTSEPLPPQDQQQSPTEKQKQPPAAPQSQNSTAPI